MKAPPNAGGCPACDGRSRVGRRFFLSGVGVLLMPGLGRAANANESVELPGAVAGVELPDTGLTRSAVALLRSSAPPWLFNHCMRTFLFGALCARHEGRAFDPEAAFVAAALHDLGLLSAFESQGGAFEIDGADVAAKLVKQAGRGETEAHIVWNAIAMHDRWSLASHQGAEAALVAAGAGCDVGGVDDDAVSAAALAEVLNAFPRLQFKTRFAALLTDHCRRKPFSQSGTWLDSYCRAANPDQRYPSTIDLIEKAPFLE